MKEAEERVAFWRDHWQAWAESGLSQRVYCARHALSYAAFGYWRNRVHAAPAVPTPAFVPVVIAPPETEVPAPPSDGAGIEIRLAHGRTIRVAADFDEAVLARVIRVLEQVPC
jgi:hypothetical protein